MKKFNSIFFYHINVKVFFCFCNFNSFIYFICLKDENNEYYPINMLIYVLLHELSHKINKDDIGHTEKFHNIFQALIEKAHNMGIYDASIPPIKHYCTHTHD